MKTILLFLLLFSIICSAQEFKLVQPDVKKLSGLQKVINGPRDAMHLYLLENYKPVSEARITSKDSIGDFSMCYIRQDFEKDISIGVNRCLYENWTSLTLPKIEIKELKRWIEKFNKIECPDIKNVWEKKDEYDNDIIRYTPKNKGHGCYYSVELLEDKTIIYRRYECVPF